MMSTPNAGWIELICGPMFSGKTEELIRRLRRAQLARQRVAVYKPAVDTRYALEALVSHSAQRFTAEPAPNAQHILGALERPCDVVGIDEVQFFDREMRAVAECLADSGIRVVAAGLDMDYRGGSFETVAELMACAEHVSKLSAICARCGQSAHRTLRLGQGDERIQLGASDEYEAVCRRCFRRAHAAEPSVRS